MIEPCGRAAEVPRCRSRTRWDAARHLLGWIGRRRPSSGPGAAEGGLRGAEDVGVEDNGGRGPREAGAVGPFCPR